MTRYLTAVQIGRINQRYGGEGLNRTNRAGVEAAAARPASGFGTEEAFGSIWEKAGALLHALCSTQYFLDGNKRTAWMSTISFLRVNGVRLPTVPDVEAEAFVLAVAVIDDFGPTKAAEWFESCAGRRRPGLTADPRLEYLMLARDADFTDPSMLDLVGGHAHGITVERFPQPVRAVVVTRIHWRPIDAGRRHQIEVRVRDVDNRRVLRPLGRWALPLNEAVVGGHPHHPDQILPVIVRLGLEVSVIQPGAADLVVVLDGDEAGRIPVLVSHVPDVPDTVTLLGSS